MGETNRIYIELPVGKEFARLLRLLVSGIAARMNFDLDAVEDLKIAIEEAFLLAIEAERRPGPLQVIFSPEADRLEITFKDVSAKAEPDDMQRRQENYGQFILQAVVDDIQRVPIDGTYDLKLIKYLAKA